MRVALIGGTGFIGHHVTKWLVEAGADVTAIHRGQTPVRASRVRSLKTDRKDPRALTAALTEAVPDVVVDMTAYTGKDMECLLAALPSSLRRLVVISSGDVYWTYGAFLGRGLSHAPPGPLNEQSALRDQLYPYRAQASGLNDLMYWYEKIVVEQMARRMAPVPVTVLRLPMVYGPNDPHNRVGRYLDRMRMSEGRLPLNSAEAAWRCTRGYVEDVAWAIRLATLDDRAAGEVFNVGEEEALTELDWVRAIARAAGWVGDIVSDATTAPSIPAHWETSLVVDTRRIREVLGYREPIGRHEGLRYSLDSVISTP